MNKNKRIKVEKWLKKNKNLLKIAALERNLGYSRGTISKFLNDSNKRKLKEKEIDELDRLIQTLVKDYIDRKYWR